MPAQILLQQAGPLPIQVQFESPVSYGDVVFCVSATAWSTNTNTPIGVTVYLDGDPIGTVDLFSNQPSEHRTLPLEFIPAKLPYGTRTLALGASTGETVSDANDRYSVCLIY